MFLDRDGTINKNIPYIDDYSNFRFYDNTFEALKLLEKEDYKIIIITNQSGIGRGFFTENKLERLHEKMLIDLKNIGIKISGIYFCSHKPIDNCTCRKPRTELLDRACNDFGIDANKSYFIGDKISDILAGNSHGCKSILVRTGHGKSEESALDEFDFKPNKICNNILDAVNWIVCDSN